MVRGPGALARALPDLPERFTLLTTRRAAAQAPALAARAERVVHVPRGLVEQVAGYLREEVEGREMVALGGGRVMDTGKALTAAVPGRRLVAVPTTLSGAEMTRIHRTATGLPPGTPKARAWMVVNDPFLSASAPIPALAASSANALGHALTAAMADTATPDIAALAHRAAGSLVRAWADPEHPRRLDLAYGALDAARAMDRTGLGLHHVGAQTLVRVLGMPHAEANARVLGHSIAALATRAPERMTALEDAAGDLASVAALLGALGARGPVESMAEDLDRLVATALARPQAGRTGPPPGDEEWRALYRAVLAGG
ncbi:MAG: iron-containing alcohol dehydrogenase [Miltoncostaeaceae bacterium]